MQDFVRHNLLTADNIAVGRIEARRDRERIEAAAAAALADDVVAKLPDGYDQMIGKRLKGGVDLSGRRVAEDGDRPCIHVRRAVADPRRANRRARCESGIQGVPTFP